MSQQHQLFEHEEHEDAEQQRAERLRRRQRLERLGQEREERHAEQRADGVADQPRQELGADVSVEQQQRGGNEQTAQAAEEAQPERGREHMHATF